MPPRSLTGAGIIAAVMLLPAPAAAQRDAFIEAFIRFHSALAGTYGDEGVEVRTAFDRMVAGLDSWEQSLRRTEAEMTARQTTIPAEVALLYAEQGRYDDAIRAMDDAIAADPTRGSLYAYQGLLKEEVGRPTEAALTFATGARRDPVDPVVAYLAASLRSPSTQRGGLEPALTALMAADRRSLRFLAVFAQFTLINDLASRVPMFSPAAYTDGFNLFTHGQYRDALTHFRTTLAADPLVIDPAGRSIQVRTGLGALREHRHAFAIEQLEAAVTALPRSAEAHRLLGLGYGAAGLMPESIRELEAAVRLAPTNERACVALGAALAEAGRLADAERVLHQTAIELPFSGQARWVLADVYERMNRTPDAIAVLEEAASLTVVAGKTLIYKRIALLAHRVSDQDRVLAALTQHAKLVPNEPSPHRELGLHYAKIGRHEEALVELLMATLLGDEDPRTPIAIGQMHLATGRLDDAERALRRAVAADASNPQARYLLGAALIRLKRTTEGQRQLDEFRRLSDTKLNEHQRLLERESKAARILP